MRLLRRPRATQARPVPAGAASPALSGQFASVARQRPLPPERGHDERDNQAGNGVQESRGHICASDTTVEATPAAATQSPLMAIMKRTTWLMRIWR